MASVLHIIMRERERERWMVEIDGISWKRNILMLIDEQNSTEN